MKLPSQYEITQLVKTNHPMFQGLLPPEMAHTLWSVLLPRQCSHSEMTSCPSAALAF